jgi:putative membrane protein
MNLKQAIILILKGMAMGTANVIPGVSGGTIALLTGIFERLINAIKSFNLYALKLLFKGKFSELVKHIDLYFLIWVFLGVGIAIISIANLFKYLFENYPVYIWSFFFGLVLVSVYFVGKEVKKYNFTSIISLLVGTAIAVAISLLSPASENSSMWYLILCGIIAACSMILPGLSGSFVLILLGNYQLVMIDAVSSLDLSILFPVVIGAGIGIIGFSYILSWLFKKYKDQTISALTGFVLGSVMILWPWKTSIIQTFGNKEKLVGYKWLMPELNTEFFIAVAIILAGIATVWAIEHFANRIKEQKD